MHLTVLRLLHERGKPTDHPLAVQLFQCARLPVGLERYGKQHEEGVDQLIAQ
jgi:hypothetical protein